MRHLPTNRLNRPHESVKHSDVRGMAHTNGIESLWAILKRSYVGVFHHFSFKHLHRYVAEATGRHNVRPLDTSEQMLSIVRGGFASRLHYADLIGPNTRASPS